MDADAWDHAHRHGHHDHGAGQPAGAELAGVVAMLGGAAGRAVDLGCGTGGDAVYLAQLGFDVVGIDQSDAALGLAAGRAAAAGVTVEWRRGDVLDLPLEDASIDLACDRGCLHHVPLAEQPRYAAELARVLAPGGHALLRDTVSHGGHGSPVSEAGIATLVEGSALEVVSVVPFHTGPSPAVLAVLRRRDDR